VRFEVELANGPRVFDLVAKKEVPLRTHLAILAAVAGAERPLSREDVISLVWPDVPLSVSRNRLRVALTNLRQRMPNAFIEIPAGLQLNLQIVRVDVLEMAQHVRSAEDTVTIETEFEALQIALAPLGDGKTWATYRAFTGPLYDRIHRAAMRLQELARIRNDREAAYRFAHLATTLSPDSTAPWEAYLRASLDAGKGEDSLAWFKRRAPADVQEDPAIQDLLRASRNPVERAADCFTPEEASLMLSILQRVEETRLDLWRALLSAPESRVLAGRHPRNMHDLLQRALPMKSEVRDHVWEVSVARLCGLKAWLGDASGVLRLASEVLESSKDPMILRGVWNTVAIAHSIKRDWDLAFEALDRTAHYAGQTGNPIDAIATEGNRAFFLLHQARFDEAEAAYGIQDERLKSLEIEQARFEMAIADGYRALIPVYRQDWSIAVDRLEKAIEARSDRAMNLQMGLLQTALALAFSQLGRIDEALPLLRAGFIDAFNADSILTQQATFEFAAGTLTATPRFGYAVAVLHWVSQWREQIGTPRSQAEELLCSGLTNRRTSRESPIDPKVTPSTVGREIMRRLRQEVQQSLRP